MLVMWHHREFQSARCTPQSQSSPHSTPPGGDMGEQTHTSPPPRLPPLERHTFTLRNILVDFLASFFVYLLVHSAYRERGDAFSSKANLHLPPLLYLLPLPVNAGSKQKVFFDSKTEHMGNTQDAWNSPNCSIMGGQPDGGKMDCKVTSELQGDPSPLIPSENQ